MDFAQRVESYRKAVNKGLLKVMSKMGVSTIQSFCGAQLFEAVGIGDELVDRYFCRAISQVQGLGLKEIAAESLEMHESAYGKGRPRRLDQGGEYAYREKGEKHLWTPDTVASLQHAVRANDAKTL